MVAVSVAVGGKGDGVLLGGNVLDGVGVTVGVCVWVGVSVAVAVSDGVRVGDGVRDGVNVRDGVKVRLGVSVLVGGGGVGLRKTVGIMTALGRTASGGWITLATIPSTVRNTHRVSARNTSVIMLNKPLMTPPDWRASGK